VLREVGALARCIQSISDIKYRALKLQRGQFIFLTRICEHPGINLVDLSGLLKVDKATTTKAVQKLMKEGYVHKDINASDKRGWHLSPSEKALELFDHIIEEENRHISNCFKGFSPAEQEMAHHLLKRMRENVEQDWKAMKGQLPSGK